MTKEEFENLSKNMTPEEKRSFAIGVANDDANQAMVRQVERNRATRKRRTHSMTDKELSCVLIDIYTDLQRIQNAEDRDRELRNQLKKARAKLEALGVVAEDLKME